MSKPTSDCRATERKHPWPMVRLGDVCEVRAGASYKDVEDPNGRYPIYGTGGIMGRASQYRCPAHSVIVGRKGTLDNPFLVHEPFWNIDTCFGVVPSERIIPEYLFRFCQGFDFYSLVPASGRPSTTSDAVRAIEIPLPPLPVQREIVARLERELAAVEKMKKGFEALAETAKQGFKAELKEVFEALKSGGAEIGTDGTNGTVETRRLGEICEFMTSGSRGWAKYYSDSGELFITIKNVKDCAIDVHQVQHVKPPNGAETERTRVKEGDLLISITADLGRTGVVTKAIEAAGAYINQHLICVRLKKDMMLPMFAAYYVESEDGKKQIAHRNKEAVKAGLNFASVSSILLPFPSLPVQRQIVDRLSAAKVRAEKLEAKAHEGVAVCETMRKAILKEAFDSGR